MGRPSLLNAPAGTDDTGKPWTNGERVVARIGLGLSLADACRDAGVSDDAVRAWRARGAEARDKADGGGELTPTEADYLAFLGRFEAAGAEAKASILGGILRAGTMPQIVKKITVRKERQQVTRVDGSTVWEMVEVERTEVIEERPPVWTALGWTAERRWPDEFGRKMALDVKDDRGTTADRAKALSDQVEDFLRSRDESDENEQAPSAPEV